MGGGGRGARYATLRKDLRYGKETNKKTCHRGARYATLRKDLRYGNETNKKTCHTIPYHTIPCRTIQSKPMPYHTASCILPHHIFMVTCATLMITETNIPYHTIPQYHTIPHHTIPYHISHLCDVDDGGDDVRVDPINVVGQHAVPKVLPHTVARRALELRSRPIFHDFREVGVEALR